MRSYLRQKLPFNSSDKPLPIILKQVVQAAKNGMEDTKQMVAGVGKAKSLGDRSLGYADPGAISASLILDYMYDYIKDGYYQDTIFGHLHQEIKTIYNKRVY